MPSLTVKKFGFPNHTFEIVEEIPLGYMIWNIGPQNMIDNYLPLCRKAFLQPFDGARNIDSDALKAIYVEGADVILSAIGDDNDTLPKMERYIAKNSNSNDPWKASKAAMCRRAVPIMRNLPGIQNLIEW